MQQPGLGGLDAVLTWRSRRTSYPRPGAHGTTIRTHADPSSVLMPTYIGTNAEPVLSLLYLFLLFFYLWGTPRGIPLARYGPRCPPRSGWQATGS